MKNILEIIGKTPAQYEDFKFESYWNWCQDFIINGREFEKELQKLLANAAINHYFNVEWKKQEDYFMEMASTYDNVNPEDALKTFKKCLWQLFNRHPKELVKRAKEQDKGLVPHYLCNN